MKSNRFKILTAMLLTLSCLATSAWALSKDEAKAQGLIGEQHNGYLGFVTSSPSSELRNLVTDINNKRKAAYQESAKSAGVDRSVFELRMGQRLQELTPSGAYIELQNGQWKKK